MMFEKYMIVPEESKNITDKSGKITGFVFGARLPYYRGLGLSMVEEIVVSVDGEKISRDDITLTVHGNTYTLKSMEKEFEDRWEMGEVGIISVKKEGGLPKGKHELGFLLNLRISYMPFPSIRQSSKSITIA